MLKLKKKCLIFFFIISLAINTVVKSSSFQRNAKENGAVKCYCGARKMKFRAHAQDRFLTAI